mmetsp:Transcript_60780/g.144799  ORF Transcript_60780/g.144799 Transcript_60780/m.144799 type:complete len:666 (-) Transcript_60780:229-2226(-)
MTWNSIACGGSSSSTSGALMDPAGQNPLPDLQKTFLLMEARRLQRRQAGVQVRQGCLSSFLESFMFLGTALYVVSFLQFADGTHRWLEGQWLLCCSITLTVVLVLHTFRQSCHLPDNIALKWSKTWCWLLVVWSIYISSAHDICDETGDGRLWSGPCGQTLLGIFGALQLVTWLFAFVLLLVCPSVSRLCRCKCALKCLWRIRREEGENKYSFRPVGAICPRRKRFQFCGRLSDNLPEDYGIWRSDHYHGEIFSGFWKEGLPQAPFLSQTFGTSAISMGLRIGYFTTRQEDLHGLLCLGQRSEEIRYGLVDVECSVAGNFLGHLPQIMPESHKEKQRLSEVMRELEDTAAKVETLQNPPAISFVSEAPYSMSEPVMPPGPLRTIRSISCPDSGVVAPRKKAVVLVHGYNCSLAAACLRLGQLLALVNMKNVLPIVFSWSTGASLMFFCTRATLAEHARDLPTLLGQLEQSNYEVHLIAHSMGCELVGLVARDIQISMERMVTERGLSPDEARYIRTITLINSTASCSTFFQGNAPELVILADICERVTLYCDREDWAVQVAEVFAWYRSVGRHAPEVMSQAETRRSLALPRNKVDVIDCTTMDANVHGIRHSYFDINTSVVSDIQQLIATSAPADERNRLTRIAIDNAAVKVFTFLAPPTFVNNG